MKHIVTGIVAHVDAGKTTLSESLLFKSGQLRKIGRVDNGDTFLDSDKLEKKRGITIFSHQASLKFGDTQLTLLDTPGHVDFAAQTEQVLDVLDYAILVISATDGIQGYTRTLWRLLKHRNIPVFIFVNKMDANGVNKSEVLKSLQETFHGCIDFDEDLSEESYEEIAMQDDDVLEDFLDSGEVSEDVIREMIKQRKIFPCYFGAALKQDGVDNFLQGIDKWTIESSYQQDFGAKVFKVSHDDKGERLTWLRVTGGVLINKSIIVDEQKANQLRIYNGSKFTTSQEIVSGGICTIPGLVDTFPGQGIGVEKDSGAPEIQPVLNYSLDVNGNDVHECLKSLRQLEDENQQLHVTWSSHLQEIHVQIMGKVQLEILQQEMLDRFNLDIRFGASSILYKETVTKAVEGVGHFEPLRHYAEVHLLLKPNDGKGLIFNSDCDLEVLSKNWQHQVLTNLNAKEQLGVLTGSPLTNMDITLVGGRFSNVHSVGGDFREATWRAVRQGLMELKRSGSCQLLEPWYRFRLEVNATQVGRAMNDIQKMSGSFDTPKSGNIAGNTVLTGIAPVSEMQDYAQEVQAYTHGQGEIEYMVDGYNPCHNTDEVVEKFDYDPVSDLDNTPGSVFCAHGAGYPVKWEDVPNMAHFPYVYTQAQLEKIN
ncbi:TetM/TetW/TetO/TetS family tetracycline resistance ribosomal protection protein [Companilactobacillus allii]|uniref:Elongation factor G n=1 Tax=Companilactobacillus allii TaxID=1847728 RepID=A0A1P8Q0A0_9LACO|nr:TetM/TetW/TetO/TetS family tetracycline resistance ribosomal protection protein [Companilactobacillus allii]APX71255.1 elongation factor G [Companilactobacillus allii]USQ68336.1 TetM/TetW/TetO/TetS family tetracycline resistance ribosomal protection protein [Companilactobacillus allii]